MQCSYDTNLMVFVSRKQYYNDCQRLVRPFLPFWNIAVSNHSVPMVNDYNAAKQYSHFYNEDIFMLGHSSATMTPILRCINIVTVMLKL